LAPLRVAPWDKLSVPLVMIFAWILLEKNSPRLSSQAAFSSPLAPS
jgi:uncharacterized membrane protein